MSALSIALFVQVAGSCPAAGVPVERMVATAQVESGFNTTAIHDNATDRSYAPANVPDAVALARSLLAQGHRIDAGLMQITDANWQRLGLNVETVFDARANICAGKTVLADAYSIERRVSCRYNTGKPDCSNGYPERIDRGASYAARVWRIAAEVVPAIQIAGPYRAPATPEDTVAPEPPRPPPGMEDALHAGPPVPDDTAGLVDAFHRPPSVSPKEPAP